MVSLIIDFGSYYGMDCRIHSTSSHRIAFWSCDSLRQGWAFGPGRPQPDRYPDSGSRKSGRAGRPECPPLVWGAPTWGASLNRSVMNSTIPLELFQVIWWKFNLQMSIIFVIIVENCLNNLHLTALRADLASSPSPMYILQVIFLKTPRRGVWTSLFCNIVVSFSEIFILIKDIIQKHLKLTYFTDYYVNNRRNSIQSNNIKFFVRIIAGNIAQNTTSTGKNN